MVSIVHRDPDAVDNRERRHGSRDRSGIGIGRVSQAVAEEVEGEHDQDHRDDREHEPGVERHDVDVLGFGQQHAPGGDRGAQAEAEEGERGLAEDHRRDRERRRGDQVAHEGGHEVAEHDAARPRAHQHRGGREVLLAQRQDLGADRAGEAGPVDQAEDDRDAEVDPQGVPGDRQGGRERHPQGQLGEAPDHLDRALHQAVDPAAVVAREPAQDDAEHEAHGDAEQAHGQRDAGAVDDAREHVAAEAVGAEQEQGAVLGRADEVEVGRYHAPEAVLVARAEEAQRVDLVRIERVLALQVLEVELEAEAVDVRPDEAALVPQMHVLRREVDEVGVAAVQVVGRDPLRDEDRAVHQREHPGRDHRDPVAAELPPHQLPLRGGVEALLLGRQALRLGRIEGLGVDVVDAHRPWPLSKRMRGSSMASAMSESSTPTTVSSASSIRNEPARYMSWVCSARSSIGPVVGSESTIETIAAPEMTEGSRRADVGDERVERHAQRVLAERPERRQALGLGGGDIGLLQLVQEVGAQPADHAGGARGADHQHRHPQMLEHREELAPAHRLIEILRVHQAADRGAEHHVGEVQQHERQQEVGRREPEEAEEGQRVVAGAVLVGRRIDPDRERHHPGEQDGREGDDEGQQQPVADHRADRQVVLERVAEIAAEQAAEPDQVLLPPRLVEAVELAQVLELVALDALALGLQLGHVAGQVVARRQLDDHERDQADRQHRRHHDQHAVYDVAKQAAPFPICPRCRRRRAPT